MAKPKRPEEYKRKGYLNQACPCCNVNHDYHLGGRTITCVCGVKLQGAAMGKLKRVG